MFTVVHLSGEMEPGRLEILAELLDELSLADGEHVDISVQHESGWSISVFPSGHAIVENLESDDPPRSANLGPRNDCLLVMRAVALGSFDQLESISWREGY